MKVMQERMEAKIEGNNKLEVLQVFRMDIHQARTEAMQEKTDANVTEMEAGHKILAEMRA
jgi:hypothetical protein